MLKNLRDRLKETTEEMYNGNSNYTWLLDKFLICYG